MSIKELTDSDDDNGDVELEEVDSVETEEDFSSRRNDVWVNEILTPIKSPILCRVPQKIVIMLRSIERIMITSGMGALEFGIYVKGKLNDEGILVVEEDIYIPEQKVTGAAIDFIEEPPNNMFNGVIHRHPGGCKFFSGTDDTHINQNFDFSLLYVDNHLNQGILNVKLKDILMRLQIALNIQVMYPVVQMDIDNVTNKIKKDEVILSSRRDFRDVDQRLLFGDVDNGISSDFQYRPSVLDDMPPDDEDDINDIDDEDDEDVEEGLLHICKKCGEPQYILDFPHICESCEKVLDEVDYSLLTDINSLSPETRHRVFDLLEDEGKI